MDFLKGQLDRIQQQLGGLNASQKMLTGSLIAIMVMTLLWWGRYAGTAEMEPVLPQALTATDIGRMQGHFKSMGIPSKVEGDVVLVPADRRDEALASLAFADILPENSASGFDEISKQLNSFMANSTTEALFKEGKQKTLQNVIRRFPGVKDAVVLIEPAGPRRVGASNNASASVAITMKDGGVGNRKIAEAAAALVASAQQHLSVTNTAIVIGHKRYRVTSDTDGSPGADEVSDFLASQERYYEEKVQSFYSYIDGLLVKVVVNVNMTSTQTQSTTHDRIQQKEKRATNITETEPVPVAGAGEPGALPNTGASIDQAPAMVAGGGERSREENETDFENIVDTTTEVSSKPAGNFSVASAAVRVPRSYFLRVFKNTTASTAEPTLAALQPIIDAEVEKIRNDVVWTTGIEDLTRVAVSMYDDSPSPILVSANAAPPSAITQSLGSYGKEIAIGALAIISLFMVSMMVRKSTPAPVIAAVAAPHETPHLDGIPEVAGIVGDTSQMLDGMELDEDTVRTQQMLDQVSTLVGENPDAAANLVKRWLNRT